MVRRSTRSIKESLIFGRRRGLGFFDLGDGIHPAMRYWLEPLLDTLSLSHINRTYEGIELFPHTRFDHYSAGMTVEAPIRWSSRTLREQGALRAT